MDATVQTLNGLQPIPKQKFLMKNPSESSGITFTRKILYPILFHLKTSH